MHMPARTQDQGEPLDEKLAYIKAQLTAECGGKLCVKIEVVHTQSGYTKCQYYSSEPPPDSVFRYRRDMTVTIIAGSDDCDDSSGDGDTSDGSDDDQSTDSGSTGDGSSTGQSDGSGDGQSSGGSDDGQSSGGSDGGQSSGGSGDGQSSGGAGTGS